MEAIFIADAHLTGRQDPNQKELVDFFLYLAERKPALNHLFILGDLFEFWIGKNLVAQYEHGPVFKAMQTLNSRGVRIVYVEGNHDFFLDPSLSEEAGVFVSPLSADFTLDGRRIYLAHGDTVNESDRGYRILRFFLHNRIILTLANNLPPGMVWKTAYYLARLSRTRNYPPERNPLRPAFFKFSREKIREGFDFVILAHSHQGEIVPLQTRESLGTYANPGDWMGSKSYLHWKDGSIQLCTWNSHRHPSGR